MTQSARGAVTKSVDLKCRSPHVMRGGVRFAMVLVPTKLFSFSSLLKVKRIRPNEILSWYRNCRCRCRALAPIVLKDLKERCKIYA